MIEFSCECGKSYVVKDESAGRRGKCKECGAAIQVPTPAAEKYAAPPDLLGESMPWDEGPGKKLAKLARKCGAAQIYLMLTSRRFFTGEGTAEFREDKLRVRGTLGPDPFDTIVYWVVAVVIGNFVIAVIPIRVVIDWGPLIFNIACVGYLVFQLVSGREMKTLFVRPEKVKSVACKGPIVTIKSRADLAPGMNAIRMFVSPGFRPTFFRKFDKMFPEKLPDSYRAAVQRIKDVGAADAKP
jgi:hypothetical protein